MPRMGHWVHVIYTAATHKHLTLVQHGDPFLSRQTTLSVIRNTENVCFLLLRTYSYNLMFAQRLHLCQDLVA